MAVVQTTADAASLRGGVPEMLAFLHTAVCVFGFQSMKYGSIKATTSTGTKVMTADTV